jgi:hypothetical protein
MGPEDFRPSREEQRSRRGTRGGCAQSDHGNDADGTAAGQSTSYVPRSPEKLRDLPGRVVMRVRGKWRSLCIYCQHEKCSDCMCCSLGREQKAWEK